MNKGSCYFLLLLVLISHMGRAQNDKNWWVLPSVLVGTGLVVANPSIKDFQTEVHHRSFAGFHTRVDDLLQYTPTLINIGLSVAHPNPVNRNAKIGRFVIGTVAYASITKVIKWTVNETRPNGGEYAFPSGHTATAFFGAHLLAKEIKKEKPVLAYAGYGLATATGLLRLANHEHWVSDVLVGAGIGVAAAELSYYLYPKIQEKWLKKHAIRFEPMIGNQVVAMRIAWQLD